MPAAASVALFDPIPPDGAGTALYRAVKRSLLESIEAGIHAPGSSLPSEASLAAAFGVSVGTLRKAVDELVAEGRLVRRQGRGTFVTSHATDRSLFQFFRIERRDGQREAPAVEVLGLARGAVDAAGARAFGIDPGAAVLQIEQRVLLQQRPVGCERLVLPAVLFKGMTEKRLREHAGGLYALYQCEFGVTVVRAVERVTAAIADRDVRARLGLAGGAAVLHLRRQALTFGDRVVELRDSFVDSTLHDYVNVLSPARPPSP
jgi:GntR family transcriptional regulator